MLGYPGHLDAVHDVPDQLLGPGGPALGVGHDPDVVLPHLDLGQDMMMLLESLIHCLYVPAGIFLFHSH